MLKDIISFNGSDMGVAQDESPRAGNLLATQIGTLEYAQDAGIDLKFFIETEFKIQNASFKAYLVQRLLEQRVNVVNVLDTIDKLSTTYGFGIGTSSSSGGFIL